MALDVFKWCVQLQNSGGTMTVTNSDREVVFGNGYRQVGSSGFNTERREYALVYAGKSFKDVLAFARSHRLKPFAFTPPADAVGIFTVKPDTLTTVPIANGMLELRFSIVEQFTTG